jgi:hypothetical protein
MITVNLDLNNPNLNNGDRVLQLSSSSGRATTRSVPNVAKTKWSSDDDERYAGKQVFGFVNSLSMWTDSQMTTHLRDNVGLTNQPGTPDGTVFPPGSSIHDATWKNVKFMQVCRGYNRPHLHSMIGEKVFKVRRPLAAVYFNNCLPLLTPF